MPNSDTESRIIINKINSYVELNKNNCRSYVSLGQIKYLSCLKFIDGVVGNSSSGLLEAPTFKKATINIGNRQSGRLKAESVIDCDYDEKSILKSINRIYSKDFKLKLKKTI